MIEKTSSQYEFSILVPSVEAFPDNWTIPQKAKSEVKTGDRVDVKRECLKAQYGLLLRDDLAVNRVSCPTKLIEYLAYGAVPVLLSSSIGDFTELGMRYTSLDCLEKGCLPDEDIRLEMVSANYECLKKIRTTYNQGKESLLSILNRAM